MATTKVTLYFAYRVSKMMGPKHVFFFLLNKANLNFYEFKVNILSKIIILIQMEKKQQLIFNIYRLPERGWGT